MTDRLLFTVLAGAILLAAGSNAATAQTQPAQTQPAPPAAQKKTTPVTKQPAQPAPAQAGAPSPSLLGQYGDWGVYVSQAPKTKICFALTQPKERLPANLKRDPAYFFISTRPGENVKSEVSVLVGFPLKEDVDTSIQIGSDSYSLYARKDGAWVRNIAEEARLVESLRKGSSFTVKSTSLRGNVTTDRYSLSGVTQALERVATECR
jgi:invasion protein IalB